MSRPRDWDVLDLAGDPTPGEPVRVQVLAHRVQGVAEDARRAERDVRGLAGDGAVTSWIGLAAEQFRGALEDFPGQLAQLADSYGQCASALSAYARALDGAQDQADRALALGRAARAELEGLQAQLAGARSTSASAGRVAQAFDRPLPAGALPPDPEQVRAATRNAQAATDRVSSLSSAVGGAQSRLDAAKRMARDAEQLRQSAGDRARDRLHEASDAGIEPNSFWADFRSGAAKVWDVTIQVAKVVVAVLGIVVLIVGGPLAWVVVGLSVLILADALMKVRSGEGGWLDVAVAALGLIPGTRGLTSLGALRTAFRSGGTLAALAHLGTAGKDALVHGAQGARSLWQGRRAMPVMLRQLPFTVAGRLADQAAGLRHGVPGALRGFSTGTGVTGRLRTGLAELGPGFRDARAGYLADAAAGGDPAFAARAWQRDSGGAYPGVDPWRDRGHLPAGTPLEGLYPGMKGFVFPGGTMDGLGRDAARISEAAQVGPSVPNGTSILHPYRGDGVRLLTTTDVPAATSTARANPQYGGGGATQHFVPDFGQRVLDRHIIAVDVHGVEVPTFVDGRGGVWIKEVDGGTIPLQGVDVRPGVWDPASFARDRQAVLDGVRPVVDAVRIPLGLASRGIRLAGG